MGQEGIFLEGHIYRIDMDSKIITVSWVIGGCGGYALNHTESVVGGGPAQNNTVRSYDPSFHPVNAKTGDVIYIQGLNEFQTSQLLNIDSDRYLGQYWTQEHESSFDWCRWSTSVVFINPQNVSEEIPLIHVKPTDLANNFVLAIKNDLPIYQTLPTLDGSIRTLSGRRLDRNAGTKTFVMMVFFINWALTIVVFNITALSLVSKNVEVSEGALVLPVTVILTIPALRSLFPEGPPFGIYMDNVGLFLQMIITSVCSIVLLVHSTRSRSGKELSRPQGADHSIEPQIRPAEDTIQIQMPTPKLTQATGAQAPQAKV